MHVPHVVLLHGTHCVILQKNLQLGFLCWVNFWVITPDFTKFSGQDDTSTMEHVNRFIIQCGEAANRDELRVRLFSSSLSGSAFTWFISLPPNSVITWADLEKQFHKYFFSGVHEKKITDLVRLKQRNDESVKSFVQRL